MGTKKAAQRRDPVTSASSGRVETDAVINDREHHTISPRSRESDGHTARSCMLGGVHDALPRRSQKYICCCGRHRVYEVIGRLP